MDINGVWKEQTCTQLEAQILQHEVDHLNGVKEELVPRLKNLIVGKKVGRNDSCPCDSGKKYKHCCGKGR